MARRADYALGKAIRDAQARGEVATKSDNHKPRESNPSAGINSKQSPTDIVPNNSERQDLYKLADHATPDDLDRAISVERSKGENANLSRANLVRKVTERL